MEGRHAQEEVMIGDQTVTLLVSAAGVLLSLGYYPQAYRIWKNRRADDISITSFIILVIGTNTYLAYGFYRHDSVLISGFLLGAIGSWLILILTLYYRRTSSRIETSGL